MNRNSHPVSLDICIYILDPSCFLKHIQVIEKMEVKMLMIEWQTGVCMKLPVGLSLLQVASP